MFVAEGPQPQPQPQPVGGYESGKAEQYAQMFTQLMHEVDHGAPSARLSARLRIALERMSPAARSLLVSQQQHGCAPLFVAARRGNAEMVEYLVHVCGAPLEQRGEYTSPSERATHSVTPLWVAAVAGELTALRVLVDAGADLEARSDSGSTPLRSACFMTHLDVVRFLCERGADVHARNHNGGTCLINGVQSAALTRYLLQRGASVDARDAHGKTALHYATQEHRLETVQVLVNAGASPHVRSAAGDDALQTACVRGAAHIVELLCFATRYPPERVADAYELLGATQLDEFHDATKALASWRHATDIRHSGAQYVAKRPAVQVCVELGGAREWEGRAELAELAVEPERMHAQALLVAVRLLGAHHKDTLFRLMYRGAWHADAGRYRSCVELWTWALQVRLARDTLLHTETCRTLCALTRLLVDLALGSGQLAGYGERRRPPPGMEGIAAPPHAVVMRVLRLVARALPESQRLVRLRPWSEAQAEAWDRALRCIVHLAAVAESGAPPAPPLPPPAPSAAHTELLEEMKALTACAPATHSGGESLLHLASTRLTGVRSGYSTDPHPQGVFPSVRVARLLLAAGARAPARDRAGRTPLHAAAMPYNFSAPLIQVLVASGAHACTPDARGEVPLELMAPSTRRLLARHVTLACLAARALLRASAPAPAPALGLPRTLLPFLALHAYSADEDDPQP